MADAPAPNPQMLQTRLSGGKRLLQAAYLTLALLLTAVSLWPAAWTYLKLAPRANGPLLWTLLVILCVMVFNYVYLVALLTLRILIPTPKEGWYPQQSDGRPPKETSLLMINIMLSRLRYNQPWSAMFSSVLVTLPPLAAAFRKFFGPHTDSITFGDSVMFLDPYLLYAGNDVQFGFRSFVTCHLFDNRGMRISRVVVEDHALIGGFAKLMPGVRVGHHSIVALGAIVMPNTVIGPYEIWAGNPAKKIKDLPGKPAPEALPPADHHLPEDLKKLIAAGKA